MAQIEDADDFANAYKSFEKDPSVAMKQMSNDLGYLSNLETVAVL